QQDREGAVVDPRRHLLVAADLDQLDLDVPGEHLAVVLHVVLVGRPQHAHRDHGDPHPSAILRPVPEDSERHFNIHTDPETMAGHYSNFANVSHSDYELTAAFRSVHR